MSKSRDIEPSTTKTTINEFFTISTQSEQDHPMDLIPAIESGAVLRGVSVHDPLPEICKVFPTNQNAKFWFQQTVVTAQEENKRAAWQAGTEKRKRKRKRREKRMMRRKEQDTKNDLEVEASLAGIRLRRSA
jgi:hypothetical protein